MYIYIYANYVASSLSIESGRTAVYVLAYQDR